MQVQAILWDVDGTLLDFKKSESYGIRKCLEEIGYPDLTEEQMERYSLINHSLWKLLERGEITKPEVLQGRFEKFFLQEGIECSDIPAFNEAYQKRLGECFFENDGALGLLEMLSRRYRQYVVTNGTVEAQRNKLKNSGIERFMDGIFISDEIGYEKPSPQFFAPVLKLLEEVPREEILIVGDSLTSDMTGGNNIGVRCCWYNPQGAENTEKQNIDYVIHDLKELYSILKVS